MHEAQVALVEDPAAAAAAAQMVEAALAMPAARPLAPGMAPVGSMVENLVEHGNLVCISI